MKLPKISRRDVLKGSAAVAAGTLAPSAKVLAQAPPPAAITPELIKAAQKEGRVIWYTSLDLPVAERVAKQFAARYQGITPRVERTGAERVYQRIGQEYASKIHAVDVVQSSDAAHFIVWKRNGILLPYVPEDVAKFWPGDHRDPDGQFATFRAWLCCLGYNTSMLKAPEAPKSFADLLDPKWAGKMVKAHPGYSGTIMTATFQITRELGWEYLEKLAKQKVMQVQSSADPPKKLALGERAVMADGNEYNMFQEKEAGRPVEIVYPSEGTPLIIGPNGLMKAAPNPNAAKLFQSYCYTAECQQLLIDVGGLRSVHPNTKEKPGRTPFASIKKWKDDPAGVDKSADMIKKRYSQLFGV
jgi:iron(III) transport system substrate-binding protein